MLKKLFLISFLLTLFNLVGQNLDPLRTDDYFLQEKWVDSILSSMTIDEKDWSAIYDSGIFKLRFCSRE